MGCLWSGHPPGTVWISRGYDAWESWPHLSLETSTSPRQHSGAALDGGGEPGVSQPQGLESGRVGPTACLLQRGTGAEVQK